MPSASRRERWYTSDRRYRLPSDWGRRKLMRLHPSERQPGLLDWTPRRVGGDSPATPV